MAKKVMVVDDSRTVRQQLGVLLADAGYEVLEASDGLEGVEKIGRTPDIAMVISDVNMPRMDGIQMLTMLRENPKTADLLVLMLTTEGQPGLIARAKAAGARGWIVKPFKPDLLLGAVRKLVGEA